MVLIAFVVKKAMSKFSYYQDMWVKSYKKVYFFESSFIYYFKAEHDAFKRKLYLRAKDLAGELTNEFLIEERSRGYYFYY